MKEPVLYEIEPTPESETLQKLFSAYKELHDIHGYKKRELCAMWVN